MADARVLALDLGTSSVRALVFDDRGAPLPDLLARRPTHLDISDEELAARLKDWKAPEPPLKSGYWKLYIDHVLQADEGCDLDFLVGKRGSFVPKDNH